PWSWTSACGGCCGRAPPRCGHSAEEFPSLAAFRRVAAKPGAPQTAREKRQGRDPEHLMADDRRPRLRPFFSQVDGERVKDQVRKWKETDHLLRRRRKKVDGKVRARREFENHLEAKTRPPRLRRP